MPQGPTGSTSTTSSTSSAPSAGPGSGGVQRLKANSVGLTGVVFMAVATAAPITAMTGNLPIAVGFGNGTGAPAGYLFATLVLTVFAVGYVAMAKRITAAGAFYGYISHGLGRIAGMASGMLAVLAYIVFEASIVGVFAYFAKTTVHDQLGVDLPWIVYAAAMLAVTAVLAHFDINLTAKALGVMLVAEIAVLFAVAIAVLVAGGGFDGIPVEPVNPKNAFTGTSAGLGLFFAFWSWVGFESTAMYGEESRDPKRVIPKATIISVVGVGLFYIFVSWMTIAGNGLDESVALSASAAPSTCSSNPPAPSSAPGPSTPSSGCCSPAPSPAAWPSTSAPRATSTPSAARASCTRRSAARTPGTAPRTSPRSCRPSSPSAWSPCSG